MQKSIVIPSAPKNIAIDFDATITSDHETFAKIIETLSAAGHRVYIVTMRHSSPNDRYAVDKFVEEFNVMMYLEEICFTGLKAKRPFMEKKGVQIDIWFDDSPHYVDRDFGGQLTW